MEQNGARNISGLQIIVGAMMAGLLIFGIIALAVGPLGMPDPAMTGILLAVLAFLGATELIGYLVLRTVMLGKLRTDAAQGALGEDPEQSVLPVWSTLTLIRSAMTEGWGLFGSVITLLAAPPLAMGAIVLALALLGLGFPTRDKLTQLTVNITGQNPYAT
jgi:disulfide bond formation protein DsbB